MLLISINFVSLGLTPKQFSPFFILLKITKTFSGKMFTIYFFFPVQFFLQETDWKKIQEEKTACEFFSISKNTVETFSHKKIPDEEQKGKKVQIFSHEKSFLQEMFEKKHILMFHT